MHRPFAVSMRQFKPLFHRQKRQDAFRPLSTIIPAHLLKESFVYFGPNFVSGGVPSHQNQQD